MKSDYLSLLLFTLIFISCQPDKDSFNDIFIYRIYAINEELDEYELIGGDYNNNCVFFRIPKNIDSLKKSYVKVESTKSMDYNLNQEFVLSIMDLGEIRVIHLSNGESITALQSNEELKTLQKKFPLAKLIDVKRSNVDIKNN